MERRPSASILVDFLVAEVGTVGDVFAADFVVHVGSDSSGGNAVYGDLLVSKICRLLVISSAVHTASERNSRGAYQ